MIYVGIDPGKTGAVVFMDIAGNIIEHYDTPLIGKEYDIHGMRDILSYPSISHVSLEQVWTMQLGGKASNFDFGQGVGLWKGLIVGLNLPFTEVAPKDWQKEMWQGISKQYKAGKKRPTVDTKATSLLAAKNLYPTFDFINRGKSGRGLKVNDGLVDATLIANYCTRKFKK